MRRSILFVCLGNICRSPAAEGLFRQLIVDSGLDSDIEIDSAGTSGYHAGTPPDARMRQAAAARGLELTGRSRQVEPSDFERFDLIIAMDGDNERDLIALAGGDDRSISLLSEFLPAGWPADVPDPYYGGADGFERVLDMIEAACQPMLDRLLADSSAGDDPGRSADRAV